MSIIFNLLAILFGSCALVVTMSYAIVWYENSNLDPQLVEGRFQPHNLWLAARLLVQETLLLGLTVLLNPLGWLPPRQTPASRTGAPILLLHGLFHNRACWLWLKLQLRRRGQKAVYSINLPPWKDLETLTERVAKKVDEIRLEQGVERVHLIGHSMGGMIARNYLQLRGGAAKVASCTLLAAPNGGSKLAPFALSPLGRILIPGSEFLQRLAAAPLPPGVALRVVYSRHDNMVLPFLHGRLEGAEELELSGIGHMAMLYHPRAIAPLLDGLPRREA
jgi:triacylglycerol lipase